MKKIKIIIGITFLILIFLPAFSQPKRVVFDYDRSNFNDGAPLPAETYFTLSGVISRQVTMVNVQIFYKNNKENKPPLYSKSWKRSHNNLNESFELDINYRLHGSGEYDVLINYYRKASNLELENLQMELFNLLDTYIDQNIRFGGNKIKLLNQAGRMIDDMNSIVNSAVTYYKSSTDIEFKGFSDLVQDQINSIEKYKIKTKDSLEIRSGTKAIEREKRINRLKILVRSEVSHLINSDLSILVESKFIDNYEVEKVRSILTIHGGYGGVFLSGDLENSNFGSAPIVGFTLPLGKKAFSSAFWSRSSLNAGLFLTDFKGKDDVTITGPIINKPFYVGLGYKVFQFIRLTAGATFLANKGSVNSINDVKTNTYVRPYLGITADLNIWMDLGR